MPSPARTARWGVIFVCEGIPEVDEKPIAEILRDMPLEAGDHRGAGVLIVSHHFAPLLRVGLAGQHGRVHQVAEQHGELAAFGVWSTEFGGGSFRRERYGGLAGRFWGGTCLSSPDQHSVLLIQRDVLGVDEFVLQRVKIRVVEVEPDFQCPVRHPPLSLEAFADLG
jgi:hypothetical protein